MLPSATPVLGEGALDSGAGAGTGAPHVVFVPSAGMGHLLPFSRFVAALSSCNGGVDCSVVAALPTVSVAEADHLDALFAAFPRVRRLELHLPPLDASAFPGADAFLLRWEALRRSAHLLGPLIAGTAPRVSAVVTDVTLASHVVPVAKELRVPCHVLFLSSATMLALLAYFPVHLDRKIGEDGVLSGRQIGEKVKELMEDVTVRERAARVGQEAAMAVAEGGTSYRSMQEFLAKLIKAA